MQYVEKLPDPTKGETRRNLNQELLSSNKKINFFFLLEENNSWFEFLRVSPLVGAGNFSTYCIITP